MGPIVVKKKRQVRKRKVFQTSEPKAQPKKVTKQKKKDKTETRSRVISLKNTLKKTCDKGKKSANMIPFVVNPHSYSQTIENLFDLSFIMKEGVAQIDVDEATQQPMITYVTTDEKTRRYNQSQKSKTGRSNGQCIVKFNPSTFCNLIEAYSITESQIERVDVPDDDDDEESEAENDNDEQSEEEEESEPESQTPRPNRGVGRRRRRNSDKEEAD